MPLQVEIVTPESKLYSDEVIFMVLPAAEGEMGVYEKHEPIVTTLKAGTVRLTKEDGAEQIRYVVAGGYAQIEPERVIVLADRAAAVEKLNRSAIRVHIDELKEQLADLKDDDPNVAFLKSEIEWNTVMHDAMGDIDD